MTTAADWIAEVRGHLEGGRSHLRNRLASNYQAGDTQLTLGFATDGIGQGATLSIGTNTLHVWAVEPNSRTVTVSGGEDGSTDAPAGAGTTVYVNPRYTGHAILRALNAELLALTAPSNGLFTVASTTLTYDAATSGYDLNAPGLIDVLEVRAEQPGPYKDWPQVRPGEWRLIRGGVADFPSGLGLRLDCGNPGFSVHVTYKAGFTALTSAGQSVATTGLPQSAWDIPPLGAAITLLSGREAARNHVGSQPDPRRANEVPPGAVANSIRPLMQQRYRRVQEEKARLAREWPVVR